MAHLALLGDSIFDNAAYTNGRPDVVKQVRSMLPAGWKATLCAVDGATTRDIDGQVRNLPEDASHLVLSVGGNDALMQIGVLDLGVATTAEAVGHLATVITAFEADYHKAIIACRGCQLPLAVCTVYNGCFPDAKYQRIITATVAQFDDVIIRLALRHGLPVIDLRTLCVDAGDYGNPIEPSSVGGAKIAKAIVNLVTEGKAGSRTTLVGA
jgi:hypothetical protein